jgi:UDP-galactopyranose mutase
MKNIVIGAGLTGCIIANKIATELNETVLVIDRRSHLGGNIYDYKDSATNITVHKYGPHIFHTNSDKVWNYLSKFTDWYDFCFEPNVVINGKAVTLPFNLTTLHEVFENSLANKYEQKLISKFGLNIKIPILELKKDTDDDLKTLSDFIYKNVFENYTCKQWGLKPEEIDPSITARVPIYISHDNRYFQDTYQGIPAQGYSKMIENILKHPNIEVKLNTDFKNINDKFDRIFYTGSIDELFDYKYGVLPYRSLSFDIKEINQEFYQKTAMTNYPNDFDFTRITEHKYFLNEKSDKTIISVEYPSKFELNKNERYYPISNSKNNELYEKYLNESKNIPNLCLLGRLGEYKYYNMDSIVERVLNFFDNEF